MDRQEAIEFLIDHYDNPRNSGPLEQPDISLTGGNPGCADLITMHARFDGLNTRPGWLQSGASTGLVLGLGVWLSLLMTLLTVLTRR